jgi:hypothetical protein
MEAVAFLLHVRCTEHVACYLLHAACMMRLARKANGSPWCAEGTNRTEFPCGFSSTAAVCRTCRTLALMVLHLPVIRAAAPPGILNAPLPTAAPGPSPLSHLPPSHDPFFHSQFLSQAPSSWNPLVFPPNTNTMGGKRDGYFPLPFLQVFVRSRARASQCSVLSSGPLLLGEGRPAQVSRNRRSQMLGVR